ncbi:Conserved membrane protein of uncharacterised function [Mycobacterium tuberculosis]|nr:Conserved membrane protein of uncharacterised function [Mycobacterium tuberculosis]
MVSRYSAYRRGPDVISPDVIDRILVGACAAVWLVFTGVSWPPLSPCGPG